MVAFLLRSLKSGTNSYWEYQSLRQRESAGELPDGYAVSLLGRNVPGVSPGVAYAGHYCQANRQWKITFNNYAKTAAPVWGQVSTADLIGLFSLESAG